MRTVPSVVILAAAALTVAGCKKPQPAQPAAAPVAPVAAPAKPAAPAPAPVAANQDVFGQPMPKVGDCFDTRISDIGSRLEGMADSGSSVSYENGKSQVSYETVPGIVNSRVGDPVHLCAVDLPTDCPPGDSRGVVYRAENQRTGAVWKQPDSEHMCGGA